MTCALSAPPSWHARPGPHRDRGGNGAGKTNLLEALYVGCTGRSFRTASDREAVGLRRALARVELRLAGRGRSPRDRRGPGAGAAPPRASRRQHGCSGSAGHLRDRWRRLHPGSTGAGQGRAGALAARTWTRWWPRCGRRAPRPGGLRPALAQRNALLTRIRTGTPAAPGSAPGTTSWPRPGLALMGARRRAVEDLAPRFARLRHALGLDGDPRAGLPPALAGHHGAGSWRAELRDRMSPTWSVASPATGPTATSSCSRAMAASCGRYGSQGQQRLAPAGPAAGRARGNRPYPRAPPADAARRRRERAGRRPARAPDRPAHHRWGAERHHHHRLRPRPGRRRTRRDARHRERRQAAMDVSARADAA